MFIWWSKLGHWGGFTHSLLVWALQLGECRMYGSRGSNMDWINEKFGCHCHVQHGPGGEWRDKPWLWAMRERPLAQAGAWRLILHCSPGCHRQHYNKHSQQPSFLTATALTIHNSALLQHFRIYSLLVPIIIRIQRLGYIPDSMLHKNGGRIL